MKQFVFLFRQSRELSADEQKQRTAEVVAWVKERIAEGRELDPRVLSPEHEFVTSREYPRDVAAAIGSPLVAINFLQAMDFGEAVDIAKSHPGLRYGVSIEVRPWTNPLASRVPQSSKSASS